jgi:hypothetical protein
MFIYIHITFLVNKIKLSYNNIMLDMGFLLLSSLTEFILEQTETEMHCWRKLQIRA